MNTESQEPLTYNQSSMGRLEYLIWRFLGGIKPLFLTTVALRELSKLMALLMLTTLSLGLWVAPWVVSILHTAFLQSNIAVVLLGISILLIMLFGLTRMVINSTAYLLGYIRIMNRIGQERLTSYGGEALYLKEMLTDEDPMTRNLYH